MNQLANTTHLRPQGPLPWTGESAVKVLSVIGLVMVLLFTTHAFRFVFVGAETDGSLVGRVTVRSSPIYLAFIALQVGLFGMLFLLRGFSRGINLRMVGAAYVCLLIVGSTLWSDDPGRTLSNAIILTYVIAAAFVVSVCFEPKEFIVVFFRLAIVLMIISFVLYAVSPSLVGKWRGWDGVSGEYQFNGVLGTKDHLGMIAIFAATVAIFGNAFALPASMRALGLLLAVAALAVSNSATSVLIFLVVMSLAAALKLVGAFGLIFVSGFCFLVLAMVLAIPFIDFEGLFVFELLGRDSSFTGRDQLWILGADAFLEKPMFGHGYYGFFGTGPYSPAWEFWEEFKYWHTDAFHNSAMDMSVSLGFVGIGLLVGLTVMASGIGLARDIDPASRSVLLLAVVTCLMTAMTNFTIFSHNHLATFLMFYAAFAAGHRYARNDDGAPRHRPAPQT